jgi:hypothetical protein
VPLSKVYTTRFIQHKGLTTSDAYVVPAGMTAVVRDADAYINATGNSGLVIHGAVGQALIKFSTGINEEKYFHQTTRAVYLEGETIGVVADVGAFDAWDVTVTGYLLSNT